MIALHCPACNSAIVFSNADAGTRSICPNCQKSVDVPSKASSEEELHDLLRDRSRETDRRDETRNG